MSQEKLAEMAGIHPTHMNRIEAGRINMTAMVLQNIASSLSVPVAELVDVDAAEDAEEEKRLQSYLREAKHLAPDRRKLLLAILDVVVRS